MTIIINFLYKSDDWLMMLKSTFFTELKHSILCAPPEHIICYIRYCLKYFCLKKNNIDCL